MQTAPTGIALLIVLVVVWGYVLRCYRNTPKAQVEARLRHYALMQDESKEQCKPADIATQRESSTTSAQLLIPKDHKILLGILKKVEAKNSTLARIWTFFGAANVTLLARNEGETSHDIAILALIFVAVFLLAALRGMKQIDQVASAGLTAVEMQRQLIDDMLSKEASFRFSMWGAYLILAISGTAAVVALNPL